MAKKISELTHITSLSGSDLVPVVDVSATATGNATIDEITASVDTKIGTLSNLTTTDKTSVVNAINELNGRNILTATISSDVTLSSTSDTAVDLVLSNSIGSKLSVSNGKVVIGSGVSKVLISGKANFNTLTSSATQRYLKIKKNNTEILVSRISSPSNTNGLTFPITPNLIDVSSGDTISISAQGVSGDVLRATNVWTYITIEVVG